VPSPAILTGALKGLHVTLCGCAAQKGVALAGVANGTIKQERNRTTIDLRMVSPYEVYYIKNYDITCLQCQECFLRSCYTQKNKAQVLMTA
jgi:hypothetical protein